MIDQSQIMVMAQGAAKAAEAYLAECIGVEADDGTVPVADEQLQVMLMGLGLTIVLLETALKVNIRNPELRDQIRVMMATVSDEISRKVIDKRGPAGTIHLSS
jgi:hypothetical protein